MTDGIEMLKRSELHVTVLTIIKSNFSRSAAFIKKRKKIVLIKGQRKVTSFTANRLEVGLKPISVICSETTRALFAHICSFGMTLYCR